MAVAGLYCHVGFSPVAASRSHSLVAVLRLCTVVASLAVEHRLEGTQASVAVAHRLSCSMSRGIFLDQGLNPCLLHWQIDSLPLSHQGSPEGKFFSSYRIGRTETGHVW